MGRKNVLPELKKTSKTLTLNLIQWTKLREIAKQEGFAGPTELIVSRFNLNESHGS